MFSYRKITHADKHRPVCQRPLQGDHNSLFQMPEILLFDIFEPQSGDGVSTGGVILLPGENSKK